MWRMGGNYHSRYDFFPGCGIAAALLCDPEVSDEESSDSAE